MLGKEYNRRRHNRERVRVGSGRLEFLNSLGNPPLGWHLRCLKEVKERVETPSKVPEAEARLRSLLTESSKVTQNYLLSCEVPMLSLQTLLVWLGLCKYLKLQWQFFFILVLLEIVRTLIVLSFLNKIHKHSFKKTHYRRLMMKSNNKSLH